MTQAGIYCNATLQYSLEIRMTATTNFFADALAAIRSFSQELYAAHGGWAPAMRG